MSVLLESVACLFAVLVFQLLSSATLSATVTFTATEIASGASTSYSIVSGDFNNDGVPDLVTCNGPTISFYKGLGGGKFASPVNTTVPNSGSIYYCVAADFNRDGKLDIAGVGYFGGPIFDGMAVFLGNGAGSFKLGSGVSDQVGLPLSITTADFNGDHIPDVAFVDCYQPNNDCYIQVELGKGDGTFQQSALISFLYGVGPIVAGDFDGDGHRDIAAIATTQYGLTQVAVLLGQGNGTFQNPLTYTSSSQYNLASLAVGDFYNAHVNSLAVHSISTSGNTQTANVQTIRYSNGQLVSTAPQAVLTGLTGSVRIELAAGDLNGDFKDDLVIAGFYGSTSTPVTGYLLGTGKGTFSSIVALQTHGSQENTPFVRDLNLDSRHDIGIDWNTNSSGGAMALINTNASTNCTPPAANKLGVHICAPTSNEIVPTTFTFKGAGNAFNGVARRMELWIDGKKIGVNLADQLNITTTLTAGSHTATFVVIDTYGSKTQQAVPFTVQ